MLHYIGTTLQPGDMASSMMTCYSQKLAEEVSILRAVGRREHAVEREASWGITKLRVDEGHVIDVSEALAVATAGGEKSGVPSWCDKLSF